MLQSLLSEQNKVKMERFNCCFMVWAWWSQPGFDRGHCQSQHFFDWLHCNLHIFPPLNHIFQCFHNLSRDETPQRHRRSLVGGILIYNASYSEEARLDKFLFICYKFPIPTGTTVLVSSTEDSERKERETDTLFKTRGRFLTAPLTYCCSGPIHVAVICPVNFWMWVLAWKPGCLMGHNQCVMSAIRPLNMLRKGLALLFCMWAN